MSSFTYVRRSEQAVAPFKQNPMDTGYDLTVIRERKRENGVIFYDTDISVIPPEGYYFDIVPRSSISKLPFVLANSPGIIDCLYTGNIIVALRYTGTDPEMPGLTLPCRIVQLIPRRLELLQAVEGTMEDLVPTVRGEDGGLARAELRV